MFGVSLSGLASSQKYLDVTSNNIANANTIGFKKSRAEFADVYTNSVFSSAKTSVGMGSSTSSVSQQFTQGNLSGDTGNSLDMAIAGNGFFVLSNTNSEGAGGSGFSTDKSYTRAGAFQIDKNGYIVTAQGDYLQGWDVTHNGNAVSLDINSTHSIRIPEDTGAPKESNRVGIGVNLPASAEVNKDIAGPSQAVTDRFSYDMPFDPKDPNTYTCTTSQTIHDSLGVAHTLTYYMIKCPPEAGKNEHSWAVVPYVDGKPVDIADPDPKGNQQANAMEININKGALTGNKLYGFRMTFDTSGKKIAQVPENLHFANDLTGFKSPRPTQGNNNLTGPYAGQNGTLAGATGPGVNPNQDLILKFDATQFGSSTFSVNQGSISNDGYSTGLLSSVQVTEDGVIQAEYTNGRFENIAKIAMATFSNPQGLSKIGDTQWKQTMSSGDATPKEAGQAGAGSIKGANLEESNVDLTAELINLIVAQRNYQANAQGLQTQNTVMDSIMNVR